MLPVDVASATILLSNIIVHLIWFCLFFPTSFVFEGLSVVMNNQLAINN